MYVGDVEITPREVLISIIIVALMVSIGIFISNAISNAVLESNEIYYKALKIDADDDLFEYGMSTNVGNSLIYGEITNVDSVENPYLQNSYFAIKQSAERYTRHERKVEYEDSNGNKKTRTEVYYTWDSYGSDKTYIANEVRFLGKTFQTSKFGFSNWTSLKLTDSNVNPTYQSWIGIWSSKYLYKDGDHWESEGDIRYYFNYIPSQFSGSILVNLKNNSIYNISNDNGKINFIHNENTSQIVERLQNTENIPSIVFWVIWIIITGVLVYVFYTHSNDWLS